MGNVAANMLLAASSESEVDFMIHYLYKLPFKWFGSDLYITTTHVCMAIVVIAIMIFATIMRVKIRHPKEVPGTLQNIGEMVVEMLDKMVDGIMGKDARRFANYIIAIFIFIFIANISGLFGLRPPTADYGVTLPLGLITFGIIQYNNAKKNKIGAFTELFKPIPLLFPINLIGELATPLSLSLRLFGNILSGTVIMALIYSLFPLLLKLGIPAFLHIYFDIFAGAIQTYVFCMLTMVFVENKIADEA